MLDLDTTSVPDDLHEAQEIIRELVTLNKNAAKEKQAVVNHYTAQINYLKALFRRVTNEVYGQSSERAHALFDEADQVYAISSEEVEDGKAAPVDDSSKGGGKGVRKKRKILPDHLPREDVVHDLADSDKICPTDGATLVKVGEEVREEVVYRPAKFIVKRHITLKYGCPKCHEGVRCACPPKRLLPGSVASPSILANLLISKYEDHLPLYRQEKIFRRHQIELTRATLASWVIKVAAALQPLVNLIKDEILDGPTLQCDETPLMVLKRDGVQVSQKSYMWVMGAAGPPPGRRGAVLYELGPGRGGDVAERLLADYGGLVQTDGLKAYDDLALAKKGRRLGCMAHVRRKFVDMLKSLPKDKRGQHPAAQVVGLIAKLYVIEKDLKESGPENFFAERKNARLEKAAPIFEDLEAFIATEASATSTKTPYGAALNYALNELPKIKLYLTNGECEIDNNWIENKIRPFALGRKNWLFSDTDRGAEASAAIYTVIQTAKISGVNLAFYLESILEQLPYCNTLEDYEALMPWNWQA